MNRLRLEYAAEQFLLMMSREHAKRHPAAPNPVRPRLLDYPPEDRSSLMRAVGAAVRSSQPAFDQGFDKWCEQRSVSAE